MTEETTSDVPDLIDRLRKGDASARIALLERVADRLHHIASATLRREFPRLRAQHETGSVVHEAWLRLEAALKTYRPGSPEELYAFLFRKVRHVLLDMARRQTRQEVRGRAVGLGGGDSEGVAHGDPGDDTYDPARLAFWTEFHDRVAGLPENHRVVFDLHYFASIPQAEIARMLDWHPRRVSRAWIAAVTCLGDWLREIDDPFA